MEQNVEVSVIIPCYNHESFIAECLDSALCQTLPAYEIIVVNDGSTDGSLTIIHEYAKKHTKITALDQVNQGVVAARNNAIQISKGRFIFPLDGDDRITPTCLEEMHTAMLLGKGDVVFSQVKLFGQLDGIVPVKNPSKFSMCHTNQVTVSALYKKSDWEKYGGYDAKMRDGYEDWDFWLNFIFDNKKFYKVEAPLFEYRILQASRNQTANTKEKQLRNLVYAKHKPALLYYFLTKIGKFIFNAYERKNGTYSVKLLKIPLPVNLLRNLLKR